MNGLNSLNSITQISIALLQTTEVKSTSSSVVDTSVSMATKSRDYTLNELRVDRDKMLSSTTTSTPRRLQGRHLDTGTNQLMCSLLDARRWPLRILFPQHIRAACIANPRPVVCRAPRSHAPVPGVIHLLFTTQHQEGMICPVPNDPRQVTAPMMRSLSQSSAPP